MQAPFANKTALDTLCPHPVLLAPMVGLSHFAVRQALSEFLPTGARGLWATEMLSSRRLPSQKENQSPETTFLDKANGLCPQLLGNEESFIRDSIALLQEWGASAIDINMGCPVDRALKHNYGVALMGDPHYAAEVTGMAVRNSKVPVSVELRAGFKGNPRADLIAFARGIQDAGAQWITLHPRTAEQNRRGDADWDLVRDFKRELTIPVIGNGDVQCADDVRTFFAHSGCDRIMIGRALLAKPWLLTHVRFTSAGALEILDDPTDDEQRVLYARFLKRVLALMSEHYSLADSLRRLRFLIFHSHVWLEYGHPFSMRLKNAQTLEAAGEVIDHDLSLPQKFVKRTRLRA